MLESRSLAADENIDTLEAQLKEAKYIAEDAERKYDEVMKPWLLYAAWLSSLFLPQCVISIVTNNDRLFMNCCDLNSVGNLLIFSFINQCWLCICQSIVVFLYFDL